MFTQIFDFTNEEARLLLWSVDCGMFDEGEFSHGDSPRIRRLTALKEKLETYIEKTRGF